MSYASYGLDVTKLSMSDSNTKAVSLCLLVTGGMWVTSVVIAVIRNRKIDWFSPRVLFGLLYLVSALGEPVVSYIFIPTRANPYFLAEPEVPAYMLLSALGLTGLLVGIQAAGNRVEPRSGLRQKQKDQRPQLTPNQGQRLEQFALLVMMASCAFVVVASLYLPSALRPTAEYGSNQLSSGVGYYVLVLASLLFQPALILAACSTAMRGRRIFTPAMIVLLVVYLASNALKGDRGQVFTALFAVALVWHYKVREFRFTNLVVAFSVLTAYSYFATLWRSSGWSFALVRSDIAAGHASVDSITALLGEIGSPGRIVTWVMSWYPDIAGFFYGRTYVDAVLSLVPSFLFGGKLLRPFISGTFLFKSLFERGGFNADTGYGFAFIGEAYMNFGWFGPPLMMFLVGWLLQRLYRAVLYSADWSALPRYIIVYASLAYSLRADSINLIKTVTYGLLLLAIGSWWAGMQRTPFGVRKRESRIVGSGNASVDPND